jgi:beta-alanine--pyruvate transaminase
MKVALAYHQARGQGGRNMFISRERAYHGVNFGGVSLSGLVNNRRKFGPTLPGIAHMRHTHLKENFFTNGEGAQGVELAEDLLRFINLYGAENIAACFVEPIAGSTGCLVPPKGYLQRLRQICDAHGILLVFDEVICGFGRTGKAFAAQSFGVTPDLMTMAKGITNGAQPMGAVAISERIHDTIFGAAAEGAIEFFHGYTYSGHPVACAAGIATLETYADEGLLTRAASLARHFEDCVHALNGLPHVIDLRNLGLMAGIELAPRPDAPGKRAFDAFVKCFEQGVLIRVTADIIALSPPLIVEKPQIDRIFETLSGVLKTLG